jgi:hypothetical protein
MSPVTINGRQLGVERNGQFTSANTDPIPGGRLWPEAALTWLTMRAAFVAAGGNPADFAPNGPQSSARTIAAQRHFYGHQPPAAAFPGTSNHGWGIAVDVRTPAAAAWILRHGRAVGWSHDEGARVREWWHFRYVGAPPATLRRLRRDPLSGYTANERRWIREYDRLVREDRGAARRRVLRRVMAEQAEEIERVARPRDDGGDGKGWTRQRRRRFQSLRAHTT